MWNGDSVVYYSAVFLVRNYGPVSGSTAWNGTFRCADDLIGDRNCRNQNCVDFWNISTPQISGCFIYFLSGILDTDDYHAGDLFLFRKEKSASGIAFGAFTENNVIKT